VETREALENIEDIASVEGIDGVFIGPADLAASLGYPGEPSHPEVKAAVIGGIAKLKALGMPVGFLSLDTEMLRAVEKAGGQFIAIEIDSALIRKSALASRSNWA
jgi:4-hydroxy-2-oxoheptanedioate aldolase